MLDEKDLQAIAALMDAKLRPIHERMDGIDNRLERMDERLAKLENDSQVTRNAANTLLEWAEDASVTVKVPLFRKAE